MTVTKSIRNVSCRKSLWRILLLLLAALGFQWQYVQCAQRAYDAQIAEQERQMAAMHALKEKIRLQQLEDGQLWEGFLHDVLADSDDADLSPANMTSVRRIMADGLQVDHLEDYVFAGELHECTPGSTTCGTGGSLRVLTRDGETLFSCNIGLLQGHLTQPSHYSLAWGADVALSEVEKQNLLKEIAAGTEVPNAEAFRDNLSEAYAHTDHTSGVGRQQAIRLFCNVVRAIVAHRETVTN